MEKWFFGFIAFAVVALGLIASGPYYLSQNQSFIRELVQNHSREEQIATNKTIADVLKLTKLIVVNQEIIKSTEKNLTDLSHNITGAANKNLNLTKFNRASLVDTNNAVHEIANALNITLEPFNPGKISSIEKALIVNLTGPP